MRKLEDAILATVVGAIAVILVCTAVLAVYFTVCILLGK